MSECESPAQIHATTGGKSLAAAERPRYKSWRKKYRKMKHKFDGVLEENKTLFKEEQKLEGIARRLRENLDGLLDLLLDLNQNPALPPDLRFNITPAEEHTAVSSIPNVVPNDVTPEGANQLLLDYTHAVQRGQIPHLDVHVIRDQIDRKLAAQGVSTFDQLLASVPHARAPEDGTLPDELQGREPPGYLTTEQEDAYLLRLDAKLGDSVSLTKSTEKDQEGEMEHKHWAEMTAREAERQIELLNPQSQHNWLKNHTAKTPHADIDDNESLASHDAKPTSGRGGGKRNLAKQVGDRAVGRAREGASPSAASHAEDDDLAFVDDHPQSASKKRGRVDPDGTYRVKGGKGGASAKGKRKRGAGDETPTGSGKKARVDAD